MKQLATAWLLIATFAIPASAADPPIAADVRNVVQANNAFALDLYGRLRDTEGNLICSPYSISTALAMSTAGARGDTAGQIARTFHFALPAKRLHPAFSELIRGLNGYGLPRDYQLSVAQSLWGDTGLAIDDKFEKLIHNHYGARLRQRNFRIDPDQAREQVNRWVAERTNDKIKDLLHSGDVTVQTRLVLVNAVYFKAGWNQPFLEVETERAVFHAPHKDVPVGLMQQTRSLSYTEQDGVQVVALPYEGQDLAMVLLLPRQKDGLARFEKSLTLSQFERFLAKRTRRLVEVHLPRFRIDARFNLATALCALGMPLAFSDDADFSRITTTTKLHISKVIHQAFVEVTEGGTEAAAATASIFHPPPGPGGGGGGPEVVFRADHPFLFMIRDQRTGSILFLGRVVDPPAVRAPGPARSRQSKEAPVPLPE